MAHPSLAQARALAALVGAVSLGAALAAGPQRTRPGATAGTWSGRTPWGDPDLQGLWTNTTTTPLERPKDLTGREFLTDDERAELDAQARRNADGPPRPGDVGTYNDVWYERGQRSAQTALVVDPPDGRLPPLTPDAQKQAEVVDAIRRAPPASWEDLNFLERCITRGMPGAMMPGFYNHNYQILQTPDYVAIVVEMIHDTRIIPLDGRPHLGSGIRQWFGDSRGRWEGHTLIVETTNFNDRVRERRPGQTVFGTSERLHLVERFTRVDADTIDYRFTITDPTTFTRPWTAVTPMRRLEGQLFEYACHEGNYGIVNILKGARVQEGALTTTDQSGPR